MGIESVRLGACSITFDGIDLGYTRGGVTISIESKIDEMEILGDANNSGFRLKSQIIRAECPLAETSKTIIDSAHEQRINHKFRQLRQGSCHHDEVG
jgi:hypothetical protein